MAAVGEVGRVSVFLKTVMDMNENNNEHNNSSIYFFYITD